MRLVGSDLVSVSSFIELASLVTKRRSRVELHCRGAAASSDNGLVGEHIWEAGEYGMEAPSCDGPYARLIPGTE